MWGYMRAWLANGVIPNDRGIIEQLSGPMYGFNAADEIQLERKADMKKRGLASPDEADALALTFAFPVAASASAGGLRPRKAEAEMEYDPFELEKAA
jgi:hypothetical protein